MTLRNLVGESDLSHDLTNPLLSHFSVVCFAYEEKFGVSCHGDLADSILLTLTAK